MKRLMIATAVALLSAFSASAFKPVGHLTPTHATRDTVPAWDSTKVAPPEDKVFEMVEIEATFPGGSREWRTFLENNLNADVASRRKAPPGQYTVVVQFIVDKTGRISNINALTAHGFGMEAEVVRVMRRSPLWLPAEQNGRRVKAYRKQPITFVVGR